MRIRFWHFAVTTGDVHDKNRKFCFQIIFAVCVRGDIGSYTNPTAPPSIVEFQTKLTNFCFSQTTTIGSGGLSRSPTGVLPAGSTGNFRLLDPIKTNPPLPIRYMPLPQPTIYENLIDSSTLTREWGHSCWPNHLKTLDPCDPVTQKTGSSTGRNNVHAPLLWRPPQPALYEKLRYFRPTIGISRGTLSVMYGRYDQQSL